MYGGATELSRSADATGRPPAPLCRAPTTALAIASCRLAADAELPAGRGTIVVAVGNAPPTTDRQWLAEAPARAVAAALGGTTAVESRDTSRALAEDVRAARGSQWLARVTVELTPRGTLALTAELHGLPATFWERLRAPEGALLDRAFAEVPVDAELRSAVPAPPLVAGRVLEIPVAEPAPVAVACGDIDGDGGAEIALLGRHWVRRFQIRGGAPAAGAEGRWSELTQVAAAPLREPLAGAAVAAGGGLWAATSDRADSLLLDGGLHVVSRHRGGRIWADGSWSPWVGLGFTSDRLPVAPRVDAAAPPASAATELLDAADAALVVDATGVRHVVELRRLLGERTAKVRFDGRVVAVLDDAGAQLAVGDLDLDGQPELVFARAVRRPSDDVLRVVTLTPTGVVPRFEVPAKAGVFAVAICPANLESQAAIVFASPERVTVVLG